MTQVALPESPPVIGRPGWRVLLDFLLELDAVSDATNGAPSTGAPSSSTPPGGHPDEPVSAS